MNDNTLALYLFAGIAIVILSMILYGIRENRIWRNTPIRVIVKDCTATFTLADGTTVHYTQKGWARRSEWENGVIDNDGAFIIKHNLKYDQFIIPDNDTKHIAVRTIVSVEYRETEREVTI